MRPPRRRRAGVAVLLRSKFADYVSEIIYEILKVGTSHSAQ